MYVQKFTLFKIKIIFGYANTRNCHCGISYVKRHVAVDTQGLPHAIHITTANVTEREGAIEMLNDAKENLDSVKNVLVEGGYSGKKFSLEIKNIISATVEVVKRSELYKFIVIPQRWVVERSFGWLEKCRRLWKNCQRKINTSLQMVGKRLGEVILLSNKIP